MNRENLFPKTVSSKVIQGGMDLVSTGRTLKPGNNGAWNHSSAGVAYGDGV